MKRDVEEVLVQCAADLAGHVLAPVIETGPVKVWRMKRPTGGNINMVEIILTSLGIIIHGDQHPTSQPVHARKGLDWFVSQLDSDYLASKFLRKQYTPQAARRHVEWCMESLKERLGELGCEDLEAFLASNASGKAKLKASAFHDVLANLEAALENGEGLDNEFAYQETFASILEDYDTDTEWLYPSQEYRPEDEALLAAIQQRFRALFWERYDKIDPDGVLRLRHAPPPAVDYLIKRLGWMAERFRREAEYLGHMHAHLGAQEATNDAEALEGAAALIKAKAAPYPGVPIREAMLAALGEALHESPFATGIFRQIETAHEGQIPGIIAAGIQALVANNAHLMSMIAPLPPSGPLVVRAAARQAHGMLVQRAERLTKLEAERDSLRARAEAAEASVAEWEDLAIETIGAQAAARAGQEQVTAEWETWMRRARETERELRARVADLEGLRAVDIDLAQPAHTGKAGVVARPADADLLSTIERVKLAGLHLRYDPDRREGTPSWSVYKAGNGRGDGHTPSEAMAAFDAALKAHAEAIIRHQGGQ